jgi:prolyl-tRNA editing enzyme YbaK/EbsC (Cys-tRNA(Pro) deacylase)
VTDALDRFRQASASSGFVPAVRRFPQGTKTAGDAAEAIGCEVGQIVKSLIFVADGRAVLVLTSGANRVDEAKLASRMGADVVRRATPEEARDATGFAVGGTPPFGHPNEVRTFIDPELLRHDVVWAAAGTPDSVFPITPQELLGTSGAQVADVTVDVS